MYMFGLSLNPLSKFKPTMTTAGKIRGHKGRIGPTVNWEYIKIKAVLSISYDDCISDTWYWWVGTEVTSLYVAREGQCAGAGSVECSGWPGDTQAGCGPGHQHPAQPSHRTQLHRDN